MVATGRRLTEAYYAGYVDADGCIRFVSGTPRIEVKSVFPWVLLQFEEEFGGRVADITEKGERAFYRWSVSGADAVTAMRRMIPYLVVKRAQAELVLQAREHPPGPHRDGVVAQVSALKHRNYKV